MTLQSITAALPRNPLTWAALAGITAKATQIALCSFFRNSPQLISLLARASQIPGGSALVNYGPSVIIALATGALLRYCSNSIKPIIPAAELKTEPVYDSLHSEVDYRIQKDAVRGGRSSICIFRIENTIAYTCSNYPKKNIEAHTIFCDAFGSAQNDTIQIAAIADGCGWRKPPQRTARAMVDSFINAFRTCKVEAAAETIVMEAAQHSQREIMASHKESDLNNYYGETTFLGGIIFTATDGKRYFTGVNCGDCKLYLLRKGKFIEVTSPARIDTTDSGGRFGPNRSREDATEYTFSIPLQPGDKLFFMTDGVHDNLDNDPSEKETDEPLGASDKRKLSTLQGLPQDEQLGEYIMDFAYIHSEKYLNAMEAGQNTKNASRKEFPGKPDHMTLLVVPVK